MPPRKEKKSRIGAPRGTAGTKKAVPPKAKTSADTLPASGEGAFRPKTTLPVVGIGASAGGLEAFETFFAAMPADAGIAFILVPHLDPTHISIMPELIQKRTAMRVLQITDGMPVEPDTVYVVPPNQNLSILNGTLQLMELSRPRGVNLPIDSFLRALAQDQGSNAVCIILSGTGSDGTLGVKAIKGEAGMVMVQDEKSAKYDGMPRSAIATGLADYVLPPGEMPEQLIKYLRHAVHKSTTAILADDGRMPDALQKICILLRTRTGHDFSLYKKNTILRRLERRMHVHLIDEVKDYVTYLQKSEVEIDILFKELLIGVTNFFRDQQAFEALREKILPELLKDKSEGDTLRVWVAGCSSGEEAYSVAILLQEVLEDQGRRLNVQIFGTDIDEDAVAAARAGIYPASIIADVSPARLKRWFSKEDNHYRIKKSIREMVVFAVQSIIKNPPFTKLDLLCCRNLLIYLGPELQKRLIPLFHYSLKPAGILFLGTSEAIGQAHDLFAIADRKWKIYRRKPLTVDARQVMELPAVPVIKQSAKPVLLEPIRKAEELSAFQLVETILKQVNAPPCVIIDEASNIIYVHGRTGRYLEPAMGKASVNILEMARPGLKMDLEAAIRTVAASQQECVRQGVAIEHNGGHLAIDLTVKPVRGHRALRGLMMVIFKETDSPLEKKSALKQSRAGTKNATVETLEQELRYTKENLQTTIEELKSTNEELQSTNEELQSTNEELETSKEELQSLNEEAATVNAELQSRIDELSKINDDMKNLLDSTEIATIFLDIDLCVRRFTPKALGIIPLTSGDFGRPINHFATSLIDMDLAEDAHEILQNLGMKEKEVRSKNGAFYRIRTRPYRTINNVIDGVVI
ncbi:MAG: PAS domain-containing protein [Proteobacteria bacterium]|nr:PAS domain-containing protein [Pseudomonadota bacterium]MBU4296887.1 PAS domain-containing protein [Pseudomonadota bacterium]MCG2746525.1 PAS domain-containing protein [Desulfobulbaceae bacterium]